MALVVDRRSTFARRSRRCESTSEDIAPTYEGLSFGGGAKCRVAVKAE